MTWFGWFLICWYIGNVILSAALVGKQREPMSGTAGALSALIFLLILAGIMFVGTGSL